MHLPRPYTSHTYLYIPNTHTHTQTHLNVTHKHAQTHAERTQPALSGTALLGKYRCTQAHVHTCPHRHMVHGTSADVQIHSSPPKSRLHRKEISSSAGDPGEAACRCSEWPATPSPLFSTPTPHSPPGGAGLLPDWV